MARLEMRSNALTPSNDVKVSSGSAWHNAWMVWATHSHPERVVRGKLERRCEILHCWSQLLSHCPRDQPTEDLSCHDASNAPGGFLQCSQPTQPDDIHLDAPTSCLMDHHSHLSWLTANSCRTAPHPTRMDGVQGLEERVREVGLAFWQDSSGRGAWCQILGARSAPSNACLPPDNSPNCTNCIAVATRLSKPCCPPLLQARREIVAALSEHS